MVSDSRLCDHFVTGRQNGPTPTKWPVTRKEGNVLFNDALNTIYLRLYGVRHMVKTNQIARERKPAAAT